jgi:hypothetical protein
MRNIFFLLVFVLLIGCMASMNNKIGKLKCSDCVEKIQFEIKRMFNADSVIIYTKKLKEERFFPEIYCPVVLIYNASTKTLDFKKLPIDRYKEFESTLKIEEQLKNEGLPIAQEVIKVCDMSKFNDLIIEYLKTDEKGKPLYRFICHYNELLK